MIFLFLTIFNIILVIVYFSRVKNRRREAFMSRLHDKDESLASDASPEPEELGNVAEEKKPDSPFAHT